ncbi:MAG: alpha/beta fold hydrolase [Bryobacteraceae bacterium]|jgi:dienelactone hydrolase
MMRFASVLALSAATLSAQVEMRYADLAALDGLKLKASFYSPGKPGPGVLLLHQCNRNRSVWNDLAAQLAASGIHVLTFDLRGYGESSGERFESLAPEKQAAMAEHWPGDIDAAYQFLLNQPGVDKTRIGVGGASCGVNNAVQTARRHPEVKTLVLLSGTTSEDGRTFLQASGTLPVFISASADDGDVLPYMRWLISFCHDERSRLVAFQAAGHGADMFKVEKTLPGTIVEWFDKTLLQPEVGENNAHVMKRPATEEFWSVLVGPKGVIRARRMLEEARKKDPNASLFPESPVNLLGYERLQKGATKEAIEILKLNELAYPRSANVYDSLGDAYLADHQDKLALEYSEKCLKVLAENPPADADRAKAIRANAEDKIHKLKHQ